MFHFFKHSVIQFLIQNSKFKIRNLLIVITSIVAYYRLFGNNTGDICILYLHLHSASIPRNMKYVGEAQVMSVKKF